MTIHAKRQARARISDDGSYPKRAALGQSPYTRPDILSGHRPKDEADGGAPRQRVVVIYCLLSNARMLRRTPTRGLAMGAEGARGHDFSFGPRASRAPERERNRCQERGAPAACLCNPRGDRPGSSSDCRSQCCGIATPLRYFSLKIYTIQLQCTLKVNLSWIS